MFDLRPRYAFDATEGQIPEGQVSIYGPANSHANCIPASFTAALDMAGLGDIDPQRITNEVFGPAYRGGFGDFTKAIVWIHANVPNAPAFTDEAFNFAVAETAGQAGQLMIVAGWIDAATVRFVPRAQAGGFSHASILAAHIPPDDFVIWNAWTGQMQTYSRAVLAASLYELSVMQRGDRMDHNDILRLAVMEFRQLYFFTGDKTLVPSDLALSDGTHVDITAPVFNYVPTTLPQLKATLDAIKVQIAALPGSTTPAVDLTQVLAKLDRIQARVEKDLA